MYLCHVNYRKEKEMEFAYDTITLETIVTVFH